MKNFYGVFGINGLVVYDAWWRVEKNRKFLKKHQFKGFDTFSEAQEFAVESFLALNSPMLRKAIPAELPPNYMIFSKQLYRRVTQGSFELI